jgi:ribonuclease PH
MNIVMTGSGDMVEIQGTAEGAPFSVQNLDELIKMAKEGIDGLISVQKDIVRDFSPLIKI